MINLPGMLLWNVEVAFNNIEVSKIQPAQTYATYLRVLSEYRPALRSGLLNDLAIWMPDNPVRPEEFQSLELNKNHVSRAISLSNDGILEMYAPLMSDILLQPFLIPDNVSIRIDLVRNSHSFCLNVQPQANVIYELGILRADLCIKRHCENVQLPLRRTSVKLSYSAWDTRLFFFQRGASSLFARVLHEALVPSQFIALQVRTDAFYGDYQRNALDIQFNNAGKANLSFSGIAQPLQCYDFGDFDRTHPSKRAYFDVMSALNGNLAEPIVSFLEFTSSSFILAWDLQSLGNARGSLELRIDLNSPLQHEVVVIGCYIYERELTCHANGDVTLD